MIYKFLRQFDEKEKKTKMRRKRKKNICLEYVFKNNFLFLKAKKNGRNVFQLETKTILCS